MKLMKELTGVLHDLLGGGLEWDEGTVGKGKRAGWKKDKGGEGSHMYI